MSARYARNTAIAAVMIVGVWHVANDLTQTVLNWHVYRFPVSVAVAWAACAVVGLYAARQLIRTGEILRHAWFLSLIPLTGTVVVAAACDHAIVSPANWPWGAVGWFGSLLFWRRPVAEYLAFVAILHAITLAALIVAGDLDRVTVARYIAVVIGTTALQVGFTAGASTLRAAANWIAAASAARAETSIRRAAAEEIHAARQRRYQALQRVAANLLAELAGGRCDPSDPAVQRRCSAEAARLRRLFVETDDLPDPLVHELRACADVAERRGVVVDFVIVGQLPTLALTVRQALTDPPIEVLSTARTTARVTVFGASDRAVISVVADADPDAPPPDAHPSVRLAYHREGAQLWVETAWHAPSPSPSLKTIRSSSRESGHGSTATRSDASK